MTTKKTTTKKSWRKPKLTVLVRGKPEEMVLAAGCKTTLGGGSGVTGIACTLGTNCSGVNGS